MLNRKTHGFSQGVHGSSIVLIPLVFVLLTSGCSAPDPEQILIESAQKQTALGSYHIEYDYSLKMSGVKMAGIADIYKEHDKSRLDIRVIMMGGQYIVSIFSLPEGDFSCTAFMYNRTCIEGRTQPSSADIIGLIKSVMERDIVKLRYLNTGNVMGRGCHNISTYFDVSKFDLLSDHELEVLGSNITDFRAVVAYNVTECYDFETGVSLYSYYLLGIDTDKMERYGVPYLTGIVMMETEMSAKSLEINKDIDDSIFLLPAEPMPMECENAGVQITSGSYNNQTGILELEILNSGLSNLTLNVIFMSDNTSKNPYGGEFMFEGGETGRIVIENVSSDFYSVVVQDKICKTAMDYVRMVDILEGLEFN